MRYRAIATDLDGTLLRSDRSVSPRTREAVHAAEDAGMLVVIATGRPPRWIPPVIEELGDRGLVVCANGASVYDPARHELVHRIDLAPDVARSIVDDLEARLPDAVLGVEQGFDFGIDRRYRDLKATVMTLNVATRKEAEDRLSPNIVDRLAHGAMAIHCNWPSYRRN